MSQENVDVVRRIQDAFLRGDYEAMFELIAEEVEWDDSRFPGGGRYRGHQGMAEGSKLVAISKALLTVPLAGEKIKSLRQSRLRYGLAKRGTEERGFGTCPIGRRHDAPLHPVSFFRCAASHAATFL